jgi:hypothetical protein
VNTGICISFMPGARIFRMVTKKLMPVSVVPSPISAAPDVVVHADARTVFDARQRRIGQPAGGGELTDPATA